MCVIEKGQKRGEEGRNQFPGRYVEEQRGAPSFPRENATDR